MSSTNFHRRKTERANSAAPAPHAHVCDRAGGLLVGPVASARLDEQVFYSSI